MFSPNLSLCVSPSRLFSSRSCAFSSALISQANAFSHSIRTLAIPFVCSTGMPTALVGLPVCLCVCRKISRSAYQNNKHHMHTALHSGGRLICNPTQRNTNAKQHKSNTEGQDAQRETERTGSSSPLCWRLRRRWVAATCLFVSFERQAKTTVRGKDLKHQAVNICWLFTFKVVILRRKLGDRENLQYCIVN